VPGSGQYILGERRRGVVYLAAVLVLGGLIAWQGTIALLAPLIFIWLWGAWDAYRLSTGQEGRMGPPVLMAVLIVYGLAWVSTEVSPSRLISGWPSTRPYLSALLQPELMEYPTEDLRGTRPFQVPCVDPLPDPGKTPSEEPVVTTAAPCAAMGESLEIEGQDFFPDFEGELWWLNPIGDRQRLLVDGQPQTFVADSQGRFQATITVPSSAVPLDRLPAPGETQTHVVIALQQKPYGSLQPTETLSLVLEKIGETVALAFMATVLGMVFALPVSFLAARNLMWASPFTRAIDVGHRLCGLGRAGALWRHAGADAAHYCCPGQALL
jgi:ABC-type phosphate/phosphonate transport system permease subunit